MPFAGRAAGPCSPPPQTRAYRPGTSEAWGPAASSISDPTQKALRTLEWITRRERTVRLRPLRTGKTIFLKALGQQAVEAGMRVAWFRPEGLEEKDQHLKRETSSDFYLPDGVHHLTSRLIHGNTSRAF